MGILPQPCTPQLNARHRLTAAQLFLQLTLKVKDSKFGSQPDIIGRSMSSKDTFGAFRALLTQGLEGAL